MKKQNKWKIALGLSSLFFVAPIAAACSSNDSKLVLGNYSGYMDEDVASELADEYSDYNLSYSFHDDNEVLGGLLSSKVVDTPVGSAYEIARLAKKGLIKKIDWSRFNLKKKDGTKVVGVEDLKDIFSNEVWEISNTYTSYLGDIDKDNKNDLLLEYMIPYFYQDFIFAYRGDEIPQLAAVNNPTWSDIFEVIATNKRFSFKNEVNLGLGKNDSPILIKANKSKVDMISDARTIFDVAKIMDYEKERLVPTVENIEKQINSIKEEIQKTKQNISNAKASNQDTIASENEARLKKLETRMRFIDREKDVNVLLADDSSTRYIESKYDNILNYFKNSSPNTITLKGNSNDILNDLALAEVAGVIAYSGDIAFAINGGEYQDTANQNFYNNLPTSNNIHVVRPKTTFSVLDAFMINSKISKENEDVVYKIINDVVFSGINSEVDEDGNPGIFKWELKELRNKSDKELVDYHKKVEDIMNGRLPDEEIEGTIVDDHGYFYKSMRNFDYVNYSPVLRVIDDYVKDDQDGYLGDNSLLDDVFKETLIDIFKIDVKYQTIKQRVNKHQNTDKLVELFKFIYNEHKDSNDDYMFLKEHLDVVYEELTILQQIKEALKNLDIIKNDEELLLMINNFYLEVINNVKEQKKINQKLRNVFNVKLDTRTLEYPTNDLSSANLKLAFIG